VNRRVYLSPDISGVSVERRIIREMPGGSEPTLKTNEAEVARSGSDGLADKTGGRDFEDMDSRLLAQASDIHDGRELVDEGCQSILSDIELQRRRRLATYRFFSVHGGAFDNMCQTSPLLGQRHKTWLRPQPDHIRISRHARCGELQTAPRKHTLQRNV
jgi:hypothetical protein